LEKRSVDRNAEEGGVRGDDWHLMPRKGIRLGVSVIHGRHTGIKNRGRRSVEDVKSTLGPGRLPTISCLETVSVASHALEGEKVRRDKKRIIHSFNHRYIKFNAVRGCMRSMTTCGMCSDSQGARKLCLPIRNPSVA
jgi:hypothetical protein